MKDIWKIYNVKQISLKKYYRKSSKNNSEIQINDVSLWNLYEKLRIDHFNYSNISSISFIPWKQWLQSILFLFHPDQYPFERIAIV